MKEGGRLHPRGKPLLCSALLLLRLGGREFIRRLAAVKIERDAVEAVALAGRRRPVLEDMAEMPAATVAMNLGARHEKAAVGCRFDRGVERCREARPAGAAVELRGGVEHRLPAAGAMINPGAVLLVERAGPGALGAVFAQHALLRGVQPPVPLGIVERDLEGFSRLALR